MNEKSAISKKSLNECIVICKIVRRIFSRINYWWWWWLCGSCLSEFIDSQSYWHYRYSPVDCCPFYLLSGSTLLPLPPFPVWISTLYTRIQCVQGGVWGSGPQTYKYLPPSPFTDSFFSALEFIFKKLEVYDAFSESYLSMGQPERWSIEIRIYI